MSSPNRFVLTTAQQERLLGCRAAWEEGEEEERLERLRQREEDAETLRAIARLLEETGFAEGKDLKRAQMARFLLLVRALAPNPNLDARVLRRSGEPDELNRDLRDLLYGEGRLPVRLRGFLARRHAGGQTALQLLCAVFPDDWPLVTRVGLNALELEPEQKAAALSAARERFELPAVLQDEPLELGLPDSAPVLKLLAGVVIYTTVQETLEAVDYVAVHRLLTQGLAAKPRRGKRVPGEALYAPGSAVPGKVREANPPRYESVPDVEPEESLPPAVAPDISGVSEQDLLHLLEQQIAGVGFLYPPLTVRDYYISLQSNQRLVLLAGLSGTGKTRLTSLFAEALTSNPQQYRLLPVRPDWADSTPLLGYVNLLADGGEGRFVSTPFLEFVRRAGRPENTHRAFFLCLDEMNLARVEHYFAELLSALETPGRELLLPNGQTLRLPLNLFFSGTLNSDEATHSLSRKVLDRANTLVFHAVTLQAEELPSEPVASLAPELRQAVFLQARVLSVAAAREKLRQIGPEDYDAWVLQALAEINALLEPYGLHFAYRVRDEILRYVANSFDRTGQGLLMPEDPENTMGNLRRAFDLQIQRKVLPRCSGTREQIETPLQELLRWCGRSGMTGASQEMTRLLARLTRDGFVSFDTL